MKPPTEDVLRERVRKTSLIVLDESIAFANHLDGAARSGRRPSRLFLVGDLDFTRAPEVRESFAALRSPAILDFSHVTHVDARILGELVRLAKRLAPQRPILVGMPPGVRRIIAIAALDDTFTIRT